MKIPGLDKFIKTRPTDFLLRPSKPIYLYTKLALDFLLNKLKYLQIVYNRGSADLNFLFFT